MTLNKIVLKYNVKEDNFEDNEKNALEIESRKNFIRSFLKTQTRRKDNREPDIREDYTIIISSNFDVNDNCKNNDLRNGILRRYLFKC
jgi:hypothetical protein